LAFCPAISISLPMDVELCLYTLQRKLKFPLLVKEIGFRQIDQFVAAAVHYGAKHV